MYVERKNGQIAIVQPLSNGHCEWIVESNMDDGAILAAFEKVLAGMPEGFVVYGEVDLRHDEDERFLTIYFS